jgi:hypothetical protein
MRDLRIIGLFVFLAGPLVAQQPPQNVLPQPRINTIFPMGAKAGTDVEITVNGFDLDDPTGLHFSHSGIKAELIAPPGPPPDPKDKDKPKPTPKPKVPATTHKFKVTVPADTPHGNHDLRIITQLGVSNPRVFVVGDRTEVRESDKPHNDVPDAQRIELNSTVNGVIVNQSDVDYYVFAGKSGQRLLVNCLTSSIDSRCRPLLELFDSSGKRLAANRHYRGNDALVDVTLPADGDYFVRVCEFAYQSGSPDHFYRLTVTTGPWIDAAFPPVVNPGQPSVVTLYGRNLPGGKLAEGMTIDGRPIETLSVTVTPPTDAPRNALTVRGHVAPPQALQDGFEFRLPHSNPITLFYTDAPIHSERKPDNDTLDTAEQIAVPCDVIGRIDRRYDKDWYGFTAKKGDVFQFELFADRLGSDMDTYFTVKSVANKGDVIPEQDDDADTLHPQQFFTRSTDPAVAKFTAPTDGQYAVLVASRESNVSFGPRSVYRLRIAKPTLDFRAVVMPKSRDLTGATVARTAGEVAFDLLIDRRDGFLGPVLATVDGLPAGVTAKPVIVGTNSRWGTVVLSIANDAAPFTGPISVNCKATINGQAVSHLARPATITWSVQPGQNIPTISRLDRQLLLAVIPPKSPLRISVDLPQAKVKTKDKDGKDQDVKLETPLFVKPGDKLILPIKVAWQGEGTRPNPVNLRMEAIQPNRQQAAVGTQQGDDNNPATNIPKDKADGTITVDVRTTAAPGQYTVAIRGDTQIQFARDPMQKDKKTNAVVQAFTEPLQLTVLPLALGRFTVQPPPNNQLKAGAVTELLVRVDRQHDYAGEFQVTVSVPKEAVGVTAKAVTLPAGANEVKVPIEVAKNAKDSGSYQFTIVATTTVHEKFPIRHEVKVNGLRVLPEPMKKDEKKDKK